MALLYATELNVQVDNAGIIVSQSNGVRQGGPDSPVAFSALVGREGAEDHQGSEDQLARAKPKTTSPT